MFDSSVPNVNVQLDWLWIWFNFPFWFWFLFCYFYVICSIFLFYSNAKYLNMCCYMFCVQCGGATAAFHCAILCRITIINLEPRHVWRWAVSSYLEGGALFSLLEIFPSEQSFQSPAVRQRLRETNTASFKQTGNVQVFLFWSFTRETFWLVLTL